MHRSGFRELDRQECLRLLPRTSVGRIVYTERALPAVLPVVFRLEDDFSVLLRTSWAAVPVSAVDGAVVAFEADAFDDTARSGWSVVVTGRAAVVTDPAEQRRLAREGPLSWVTAPEDVFLRIEPAMVTGRATRR